MAGALATWAPRLHSHYKTYMDAVLQHDPLLEPNFRNSVFSCMAYNFGPVVCTYPHRDCMNCPYGLCAVTSLGRFDHELGGHLIVEELGLVIEFPSGCTILLPSAVLTHFNTPVRAHERRISITQYTPGEILRYVDNGFQTQGELKKAASEEEFELMMAKKATRWQHGVEMWSTLASLHEDAQAALEEAEVKKRKRAEEEGKRSDDVCEVKDGGRHRRREARKKRRNEGQA